MTESQADAWGEDIDKRQALSAGELRERRESNCKFSSREERVCCRQGEDNMDSG